MPSNTDFQQTLPGLFGKRAKNPRSVNRASSNWAAPTFDEFVQQLEHEFGDSVDLTSLHLIRADADEPLTPDSMRSLCALLGVPPEDFGV